MLSRDLDPKSMLSTVATTAFEHGSGPALTHQPTTAAPSASELSSEGPSGSELLQLQRHHGNRHAQQLVNPSQSITVQPKLMVGDVATPSEREADRAADHLAAGRSLSSPPSPVTGTQTPISPQVESSINQARGGGRTVPEQTRSPIEHNLGTDLSGVRVHTDNRADSLNQSLQARAFTTGNDIFFSRGAYQPDSTSGRSLLTHELTHVAQQARSSSAMPIQREPKTKKRKKKKKLHKQSNTDYEASKQTLISKYELPQPTSNLASLGQLDPEFHLPEAPSLFHHTNPYSGYIPPSDFEPTPDDDPFQLLSLQDQNSLPDTLPGPDLPPWLKKKEQPKVTKAKHKATKTMRKFKGKFLPRNLPFLNKLWQDNVTGSLYKTESSAPEMQSLTSHGQGPKIGSKKGKTRKFFSGATKKAPLASSASKVYAASRKAHNLRQLKNTLQKSDRYKNLGASDKDLVIMRFHLNSIMGAKKRQAITEAVAGTLKEGFKHTFNALVPGLGALADLGVETGQTVIQSGGKKVADVVSKNKSDAAKTRMTEFDWEEAVDYYIFSPNEWDQLFIRDLISAAFIDKNKANSIIEIAGKNPHQVAKLLFHQQGTSSESKKAKKLYNKAQNPNDN